MFPQPRLGDEPFAANEAFLLPFARVLLSHVLLKLEITGKFLATNVADLPLALQAQVLLLHVHLQLGAEFKR